MNKAQFAAPYLAISLAVCLFAHNRALALDAKDEIIVKEDYAQNDQLVVIEFKKILQEKLRCETQITEAAYHWMHSFIRIRGQAQLNGPLRLKFPESATIDPSLVFTIVQAEGILGSFSRIEIEGMPGLLQPEVLYDAQEVKLKFVSSPLSSLEYVDDDIQKIAAYLDEIWNIPHSPLRQKNFNLLKKLFTMPTSEIEPYLQVFKTSPLFKGIINKKEK
jgi:hypothetical protein